MANYLYNGVELPALPNWDKTAYPYAAMHSDLLRQTYYLRCFDAPYTVRADSAVLMPFNIAEGTKYLYFSCKPSDTFAWKDQGEQTADTQVSFNKYDAWSNYDVIDEGGDFYEDGTIVCAASDPVPVNPIDKASFFQGWLVGRRLAGMRK